MRKIIWHNTHFFPSQIAYEISRANLYTIYFSVTVTNLAKINHITTVNKTWSCLSFWWRFQFKSPYFVNEKFHCHSFSYFRRIQWPGSTFTWSKHIRLELRVCFFVTSLGSDFQTRVQWTYKYLITWMSMLRCCIFGYSSIPIERFNRKEEGCWQDWQIWS